MKKQIATDGKLVTFSFAEGLADIIFDVDKMSLTNKVYAVAFGCSHRIGDHAAISRNGPAGAIITVTEEMRRNAVLEMVAHLESGTEAWDMAKSARGPAINPVFTAIAAKLGITYDQAMAKVQEQFLAEI